MRYLQNFIKENTDLDQKIGAKYEYHDKLNPDLWDDNLHLHKEVKQTLDTIVDSFFEYLEMPEMEIVDIIITGSSANYNWTEDSDIDLHVVVDFNQIDDEYGVIAEKYLAAKTELWNTKHNITIKGHKVELYIQDEGEPHTSTAIYSMKEQEWIIDPVHNKPEVDSLSVIHKTKQMIKQIDDLTKTECASVDAIDKLKDRIRKFRKAGLAKAGEFSVENLVFKQLRKLGYLDKLTQCKTKSKDEELSLEDEEWWDK